MEDCIFCKIIGGAIPSKKILEDDKVFAFYDIDPQAPVHFLVIPKKHIPSLDACGQEDFPIIAHAYQIIGQIARDLKLTDGYRVVVNCGKDGGQTVGHLHFHVLGGRMLAWPPG